MQFADILHKFRTESFTQKDKGTQFERLMRSWLLSDPRYSMLTEVWLWEDFPSKVDFGGKDTGIDLVALEYDLNGKSDVDGIMERYAVVAQDSKSLIVNDPTIGVRYTIILPASSIVGSLSSTSPYRQLIPSI